MIKRILVPTDGSESAEIGVRYAVALARREGASLLVLHVTDIKLLEGPFLRDLTASLGAAPYVNYEGSISMLLEERGKAALAYARQLCEQEGVPCETSLQTGVVPKVICESADLVDLVVMGRAGEHNQFLDGLIGGESKDHACPGRGRRTGRQPARRSAGLPADQGHQRLLCTEDG